MTFLRLTVLTFPARLPLLMAWLVGLYLLLEGGLFGWSGLLYIAAAYGTARAVLSVGPWAPAYRAKRRELAFWKGWQKTCGALNWLRKANRDDQDVPDPELISVDLSGMEGDNPISVVEFRPRADVRTPTEQYATWAGQLMLYLGAHGKELKVIRAQGGPILRLRLSFSDALRPEPLTTVPPAKFGEFPLMQDETGTVLAWDPVASEKPIAIWSGQPGTGKTSNLRLPATIPFQWDEPVEVVFCTPKPADAAFLKELPWSERGKVVAGVQATRDYIKELRKEVDDRNAKLASDAARSTFTRPDGIPIRRPPEKIHELSPERRAELGLGFKVVLLDELATILSPRRADPTTVVDDFRHIAVTIRSAGLILCLGIHRPDAAVLGGFTRDQIPVRIFQGQPMRQGMNMLFEGRWDPTWDLREDFSAGTILATGLEPDRHKIVEGQALYLHPDYLFPMLGEDGTEIPVSIPNGRDTPRRGVDSHGLTAEAVERGWEDRARWWLRTGWATVRLAVGPRVQVPERSEEFKGTLLKTKALACVACGRRGKLIGDHRHPLWAGGADDPHSNGQLLCDPCHDRKTAWEARSRTVATGLPRAAVVAGSVCLLLAAVKW